MSSSSRAVSIWGSEYTDTLVGDGAGDGRWGCCCCRRVLPRWLVCPDGLLPTLDMRVVVFHLLLLLLRRRQLELLLLRVAPPLRRRMSRMSMLILMRMLMRMELGRGYRRHGRHGGGTGLVGHGRRRRGGGDEVLVGGVAVTPMMVGVSLGLAWVAATDAARGGPVVRPVARRIPPRGLRLGRNLNLRLSLTMQMP